MQVTDNFSYPSDLIRKWYYKNHLFIIDMMQEIVFMDRKEFTKEIAIRCQNNEAALFWAQECLIMQDYHHGKAL